MSLPPIPSVSKEWLYFPVTALTDPTTATVEMAVTLGADPGSGDWHTGEWYGTAEPTVIDGLGAGFLAWARVKIGPGTSFELGRGDWWVWFRPVTPAESPVRRFGPLTIT